MKIRSPLEIYEYLPGTNCKECGESTCMAFAAQLIERKCKIEDCPPLLEDKNKKKYMKLVELMAPQIRRVEIGTGENMVEIGGEDVLYRHELTFYDKTGLAYDVWDTMDEEELVERTKRIRDYKKFYVGDFLTLDMVAIRSVSGDAKKFAECVKKVSDTTDLPTILVSLSPDVLQAGLKVIGDKRPLIYAATKDNWKEISKLAREYNVPVVLSSPGDLDGLKSLAVTFQEMGIDDLVLDPGTYPAGKGLQRTLENFIKIRRAGIIENQKELTFPLMSIPMTAWLAEKDEIDASYLETIIASLSIIKYADVMIMHSLEPHALIPELMLTDNIYTDPRKPVEVEPGVHVIGEPDENSPVFVTTNFALTYYTVESDLDSNSIPCYLLVVGTDGLGVEVSVAGGQLTGSKIKDAMDSAEIDVRSKVKNKVLVFPGLAARLQGETEDEIKWNVLVGPMDSGRIPGWMDKNWPPKDLPSLE